MIVVSSVLFLGCGGDSADDPKEISEQPQSEQLPEPQPDLKLKINDISNGYYCVRNGDVRYDQEIVRKSPRPLDTSK